MKWTQKEKRHALLQVAIAATDAAADLNDGTGSGGGVSKAIMDRLRHAIRKLGQIYNLEKKDENAK